MDPFFNTVIDNSYRLTHSLGESACSIVYAGVPLKDKNEPVAVKILKPTGISHNTEDIARFFIGAQILIHCTHPGIVRLYKAAEQSKHIYLILEYFQSNSLDTLIKQQRIFSLHEVLTLMIRLCHALDYLHSHNIIHRDLNPANILIREKAGQDDFDCIKINDCSLSWIKIPGAAACHYHAPEQTSIFMEKITAWSDLYSLGVIFYQLLTNQLPFHGSSRDAVVYRQLAHIPPPPSALNRQLPPILDKVVLKLLTKAPERRYRDAAALGADLEEIRSGSLTFTPSRGNGPAHWHSRTRLVGRSKERSHLVRMLKQAKAGKGCICLLEGEPGSGKSRLAAECGRWAQEQGGLLIRVQCLPGMNSLPGGLFRAALAFYAKLFFRNTKERKLFLRSRLGEVLGKLGRVIIDACPACAEVIGDFPGLAKLKPEKEKMRLIRALTVFFLHLARLEGLLVLFFDDLQWAGESDIKILGALAGIEDTGEMCATGATLENFPLVILGAYREPEADSSLGQFVAAVPGRMQLAPLSCRETESFIRQVLHPEVEELQVLTQVIFARSGGNPLFAGEILRELIARGIVYPHNNTWRVDRERLAGSSIPDTLLNLLLQRFFRLAKQDLDILALAAVIGREFTSAFLCALDRQTAPGRAAGPGGIATVMARAKQWQVLEENAEQKNTYRFLHERIQIWFYSRLESNTLIRLHDLAGRLWEEVYHKQANAAVYQVVYQYLKAHNKKKLLEYVYAAGLKAKADFSYQDAARYLQICLGLIRQNRQEGSAAWIACILNLGAVHLILGKNNSVLSLYAGILPLADKQKLKAQCYMNLGWIFFRKGDTRQCIHYVKKAPALPGKRILLYKFILYICCTLLQAREKRRQTRRSVYPFVDISRLTDVLFQYINHYINPGAETPGLPGEPGKGKAGPGRLLLAAAFPVRAERCLLRSLMINKQCGNRLGWGLALEFLGAFYQWQGQYGKSNTCLQQGLDLMRAVGDVKAQQNCLRMLRDNSWYMGAYAAAGNYNSEYCRLLVKPDDAGRYAEAALVNAALLLEQGQYAVAACWLAELPESGSADKNDPAGLGKLVFKGVLQLLEGGSGTALESLNRGHRVYKSHSSENQYTAYIFIWLCDAYWIFYSRCREALNSVKKQLAACSQAVVKRMRKFPACYGSALRLRAQYLDLCGRYEKADTLFKQSIRHSNKLGRKHELGREYYAYGCFLHETGKHTAALNNWYEAYLLFRETGSMDLLKQVKGLLGFEEEEELFYRLTRKGHADRLQHVLIKNGELVKTEQSSSSLLDKTFDLCMQWLGAQRGGLFKKDFFSNDFEALYNKSCREKAPGSDSFSAAIIYDVFSSGKGVISSDISPPAAGEHFQRLRSGGRKLVICFLIDFRQDAKYVCYFDNLLITPCITKAQTELLISIMNMVVALSCRPSLIKEENSAATINREKSEALKRAYKLTHHEYRVLYFVLKGFTNREITVQLNISLQTLRTHLNHIYHKTGARSRPGLIKIFSGPGPD